MALPQKIEVPIGKVLSRLQFAKGKTQLDAKTQQLLDDEMAVASRLIMPRQILSSSPVQINGSTITLEPGYTFTSASIAKLLQGCKTAYGFAVTIGTHLEEKRALYLQQKETTRALILDAIGSEAAELLTEITNKQIIDEVKTAGGCCTKRFSPGYGDWPVTGQKDFLAWMDAKQIGITLTEHSQMLPEKSVSAIIGVK
jgi:cobalamin-dependent methionine synthase I